MQWLTIPTFPGVPRYTMTVPLSGVDYLFSLDWHDRESRWYLALSRATGEEILRGAKLVANWNLLRSRATRYRPPGPLIAYARNGASPLLHELGERVQLLYGAP